MADTLSDAQIRKLQPRFGALAMGDLLRAYWTAEGYVSPPTGLAELTHYRDRGAVGASVQDIRYDYWANKAFQYDTATAGPGATRGGVVAFWKAKNYSGAGALLDLTGRGRDLALGTGVPGNVNEPKFLPYVAADGKYVYQSGIAANYISTPSHASLNIAGDIDFRVEVAMDSWTPAGDSVLLSKFAGLGQYAWSFVCKGVGSFHLYLSTDGGTLASVFSTAATGFAAGARRWARATWRQSDGRVQFFTSSDGVAWTQLGTDLTIAIPSIFAGTAPVEIGAQAGGTAPLAGKIYKAQVRNGIGGTVVGNFDANSCAEPYATYIDSAGRTWTFNRPAVGKKLTVVDRSLFLLSTDDVLVSPNHADLNIGATDNYTILVCVRYYATPLNTGFVYKGDGFGAAYFLYQSPVDSAQSYAYDAADVAVGGGLPIVPGVFQKMATRFIRPLLQTWVNNTIHGGSSNPAVDALTNADPLRVGLVGAIYGEFEFIAGAMIRRGLTDAEMIQLGNELAA